MRLIQISDTHLFADPQKTLLGVKTSHSLHAVIDLVRANSAASDMIILTGDISQDYTKESYLQIAKLMEKMTAPIYWLAGNHDAPEVMQKTFATTHFKEDKAILLGKWLLILLNSHYPNHTSGMLGRSELSRLDYYLTEHPSQHTLIFLHHQPIPVGCKWLDKIGLQNADDFFAIVERHPAVRGIVCGHVHQEFSSQRQGVPIVATPSTCIQFLPNSDEFGLDHVNPGYRWFELHADGTFETGIERLVHFVNTTDFSSKGY